MLDYTFTRGQNHKDWFTRESYTCVYKFFTAIRNHLLYHV